VTAVRDLTADGRRLPPDWAVLAGRRLVAAPAPDGSAGVQYGPDAARLPVWFATACDADTRALAGRWWQNALSSAAGGAGDSPLGLMADAAAATAAGDREPARRLRSRAAALAAQSPTYYGDAWAALGAALLDGSIDPCRGS
jgi:endoglucanase